MPTFSVVIPAYCGAATIRRAVNSALAQSVPCEVIVCDDGSPEDTTGPLDDIRSKITILRRENGGVNAARNTAIGASAGDWIVLLDQDDEWLPRRLEAISEVIAAGPSNLDVVTTDAIHRSESGEEAHPYRDRVFPRPEDQRVEVLRKNFVYASAAIRRSALDRIGGLNEETGSEYDAWVRLVLTGSVIGFVNEPLAIYHRSVSQQSNDEAFTVRGITAALEWALARNDLNAAERDAAKAQFAAMRARREIGTAVRLLSSGQRGARAAALRTAVTMGVPASLRVKFLFAAVFPSAAGRRLQPWWAANSQASSRSGC